MQVATCAGTMEAGDSVAAERPAVTVDDVSEAADQGRKGGDTSRASSSTDANEAGAAVDERSDSAPPREGGDDADSDTAGGVVEFVDSSDDAASGTTKAEKSSGDGKAARPSTIDARDAPAHARVPSVGEAAPSSAGDGGIAPAQGEDGVALTPTAGEPGTAMSLEERAREAASAAAARVPRGPSKMRVYTMGVVGLLFHACCVVALFDTYFRSPIVHAESDEVLAAPADEFQLEDGSVPASLPPPPAKRLVLVVADGLRADTIFDVVGSDDPGAAAAAEWAAEDGYELPLIVEHDDDPDLAASRAPFLRNMAERRGSWGVSHTHVPTESRPGHVALIAGFYEDVSAVTKGWKANTVEFDSVFNRSSATWAWGSPDILPMFSDTLPHVHASSYDASFEDFASADASRLDTWVFERVEEMLHSAASDPGGALDTAMRGDRCVFFLHLLGIDTNGHAHRPHSASYLRNLALVDRGVRRLTEQFNAHFGDNDTAFIFTSDHGMAAAGMHGDGDPANTRTPLIAWGAGVRSPEDVRDGGMGAAAEEVATAARAAHAGLAGVDNGGSEVEAIATAAANVALTTAENSLRGPVAAQLSAEDLLVSVGGVAAAPWRDSDRAQGGWSVAAEHQASRDWKLDTLRRRDVQQADVAPLMAALLGLPMPFNSVGVLPLAYLSPGPYRTAALLANARQVLGQAQRKSDMRKERAIVFAPHPQLDAAATMLADARRRLSAAVSDGSHSRAAALYEFFAVEYASLEVVSVSLDALTYFHTYDQAFLRLLISTGYAGWIAAQLVTALLWHTREGYRRRVSRTARRTRLSVLEGQKKGGAARALLLCRRYTIGHAECHPIRVIVCIIVPTLLAVLHIKVAVEGAPLRYHAYVLFPILCWGYVGWQLKNVADVVNILLRRGSENAAAVKAAEAAAIKAAEEASAAETKARRQSHLQAAVSAADDAAAESGGARSVRAMSDASADIAAQRAKVAGAAAGAAATARIWGGSARSPTLGGISVTNGLFAGLSLEMAVFGYFHRWSFSIVFAALAAWPFTLEPQSRASSFGDVRTNKQLERLCSAWTLVCSGIAIFPFLPTEMDEVTGNVVLGAVMIVAVVIGSHNIRLGLRDALSWLPAHTIRVLLPPATPDSPDDVRRRWRWLWLQVGCIFLSALTVVNTMVNLEAGNGLPLLNQIAAWVLAVGAPWAALKSNEAWQARMTAVIAGIAAPYVLLSVNYEVLFIAALSVALLLWIAIEQHLGYIRAKQEEAVQSTLLQEAEAAAVADVDAAHASVRAARTRTKRKPSFRRSATGKWSLPPGSQVRRRNKSSVAEESVPADVAGASRAAAAAAVKAAVRDLHGDEFRAHFGSITPHVPAGAGAGSGGGGDADDDGEEHATNRFMVAADIRAALFFLQLLLVSFFGTGNVASLGSFQIASCYRFATVFAPHLMGVLLVIKKLIPFFLVATSFATLTRITRTPLAGVYLLTAAACDWWALHFFWLVRVDGSWKDIGNSISHFVICNALALVVPLLLAGSSRLCTSRVHVGAIVGYREGALSSVVWPLFKEWWEELRKKQ